MPMKTTSASDRLWRHVIKQPNNGCWIWTGAKTGFGHGVLGGGGRGAKTLRAHRVSWSIRFGEIADDVVVCHKCDNPSCVNPDHLFLGSQADNVRDCMRKNRMVLPPKMVGCDNYGSKLTEGQVRAIRNFQAFRGYKPLLAKKYGVSEGTIKSIRAKKTWKHLS